MSELFTPRLVLQRARRRAGPLAGDEWRAVVDAFIGGTFSNAQMAAWLMARVMNGITVKESVALTEAMVNSGVVLKHSRDGEGVVDKHSTGGVADTTTLIVAPLLASAGVVVAKLSGGSLGHTGGTLDKLASIPGMRLDLSAAAFHAQLASIGVAIAAATNELAPADRLLYTLRDHIELVDDTALIAASIMSKKLAVGAKHLILDVKVGQASLLGDDALTRKLAQQCIAIGVAHGRKVTAVLSDMNQPLGPAIGNALEVRAAIDVLAQRSFGRLGELSVVLATELLRSTGLSLPDANDAVFKALHSGAALERFGRLVSAQGGDPQVITDPTGVLGIGQPAALWAPTGEGNVTFIDTKRLGVLARELGGNTGSMTAGLALTLALGMPAKKVRVAVHTSDPSLIGPAEQLLSEAIVFGDAKVPQSPLVQEIIRKDTANDG